MEWAREYIKKKSDNTIFITASYLYQIDMSFNSASNM